MVSIRTCRRHLCNSSVHPTLIRRNILIPKFIHRPGYVANTYPPLFLTCSILSPQVRASTSASWWTQCLILYDRMKVCISTNPTRDVMSYIILFRQSTREHPHAISLRYSPTMRRGTRLGGMPGGWDRKGTLFSLFEGGSCVGWLEFNLSVRLCCIINPVVVNPVIKRRAAESAKILPDC